MDSDGKDQVTDLMDFHLRWNEFRGHAVSVSKKPNLNSTEQTTIDWLIRMADRIGEADIRAGRNIAPKIGRSP